MQIGKYLETHQPIIFKTFSNALENDQLSHAYLISGQPGTPLLETAKYLAKSILCDSPSPLACDSCFTCIRVDDGNYPDLFFFDGSKETIKKEDVATIENAFGLKAFEAKGIRIYILHLVENMTNEAINAILKFLEEPGSQIFAFLTTNNENAILPTIISRCQMMRLKLIDRDTVIQQAIDLEVPQEQAELLSYLFNSGELILDKMSDEDFSSIFNEVKPLVDNMIETLAQGDKPASIYQMDRYVIPQAKDKESIRLFIDFLIEIFQDVVSIKHGNLPYLKSYDTILKKLAESITNVDEKLVELLKQRNSLNFNTNTSLLLDYLINQLVR